MKWDDYGLKYLHVLLQSFRPFSKIFPLILLTHIDVGDPVPLRRDVVGDPVQEARQRGGADQEDQQDDVGKQRRHVDELSGEM